MVGICQRRISRITVPGGPPKRQNTNLKNAGPLALINLNIMELFREYGVVNSAGEFKIYNREQFELRLKAIAPASVEVIIQKRSGTFSHQMRKYYFSVIVPEVQRALTYLGYDITKENTDRFLRHLFLYTETYNPESDTWSREPRRLSTAETDVTVEEFRAYCENIVRWAIMEIDWAIPYPNEVFRNKDFTQSQIINTLQ